MHLINTSTLKLTWFSEKIPPYAILSHTWGSEEVTFADFGNDPSVKARAGFFKIQWTCEQALQDGLDYAWVDTCCINKESSAELSEAINCMFKWYRDAAICYAYIEDLPGDIELPITDPSLVKDCRWFSRGWTLQELLAPRDNIFFGARWFMIGRKVELKGILDQVTGIPENVLTRNTLLDQVSVADRMKWAANRQTSREEDVAYCLMGIFDVNMPMMYGEGRKAFIRLQEEIVKQTQDDSLFAWRASQQSASETPYRGLFASSPKEFANEDSITPFQTNVAGATTILGNGRISLDCSLHQDGVISLKCFRERDISSVVCIDVVRTGGNHFLRSNPTSLALRAHQYPVVFNAARFERFAELKTPSVDDVYRRDGIHIARLPPALSLRNIWPREYQDCTKNSMVPIVYVIGKKIAFEFTVNKRAAGVDLFQKVWGEKDGLATEGDKRILLVLWVEQVQRTRSYTYYFDLKTIGPENAESQFIQAKRPPAALDVQELAIALSTIHVRGTRQEIDGHQMFSVSLDFAIRKEMKAEAEAEEKRREAEERAIQKRREAEERAIQEIRELEKNVLSKKKKAEETIGERAKEEEGDKRKFKLCLLWYIPGFSSLIIAIYSLIRYVRHRRTASLWVFGPVIGFCSGVPIMIFIVVTFVDTVMQRRKRHTQEHREATQRALAAGASVDHMA